MARHTQDCPNNMKRLMLTLQRLMVDPSCLEGLQFTFSLGHLFLGGQLPSSSTGKILFHRSGFIPVTEKLTAALS